jgi:polysaccharide lyase-like protein
MRLRLPPDFDFQRRGRLPGLIEADAAGTESFAARIVWRAGGTGGATLRALSGAEARQPSIGLDVPRGRWFRIEQEVILNAPKQANGKLLVWIDGVLAGERSDLVFSQLALGCRERLGGRGLLRR